MAHHFITGLVTFLLFSATAATAKADNWCSPTTAPSITVRTSTDQITYDFSLSEKQLNRFSVSTVNPYAANVITDVGGLMN